MKLALVVEIRVGKIPANCEVNRAGFGFLNSMKPNIVMLDKKVVQMIFKNLQIAAYCIPLLIVPECFKVLQNAPKCARVR